MAMAKTSLVLTVLGQDHPGLVDAIAQTVTAHGGNWVESRMAHLAGQFAGILRVEVDSSAAEALAEAMKNLAPSGLETLVTAESSPAAKSGGTQVELDLVGQDQPGIVRNVSQVLATHGVNVEELCTECTSAATTGQSLFRATARLRLPESLSVDDLRAALEQVAADLMVDVSLKKET